MPRRRCVMVGHFRNERLRVVTQLLIVKLFTIYVKAAIKRHIKKFIACIQTGLRKSLGREEHSFRNVCLPIRCILNNGRIYFITMDVILAIMSAKSVKSAAILYTADKSIYRNSPEIYPSGCFY